MRLRERLINLLLAIASVVVCGLVLEGALRTFYAWRKAIAVETRDLSRDLGWVTEANVTKITRDDVYGEVSYSTGEYGFRVFGDVASTRIKVLVLGDSITAAETVSDGEVYYDVMARERPELEVFAYGCGGYGSLQEAMILDRFVDLVRPDLIVWQFSGNDALNNVYELESRSFINNNHMTRPYLEGGRVVWRFPTLYRGPLDRLLQSSYLLRLLNVRGNILGAEHLGSIEDELDAAHPLIARARQVTSEIMGLVRRRGGDIQIAAFVADPHKWMQIYPAICRQHGIAFIDGIPEAITAAHARGETVDFRPHDTHWNAAGHAIAGHLLAGALGGMIQRGELDHHVRHSGSPLALLRPESATTLDLLSLDSMLSRGFGNLEGPYPDLGMPYPLRWMIAPQAEIFFDGGRTTQIAQMLRLRVLSNADQTLNVTINGKRASIQLPAEQWIEWRSPPLAPARTVTLRFEASAHITAPNDERQLFVLFSKLQLEDAS
ncbi:MAG: SGNH/GDSL hydrolase family protein [Acidobacteria bacterium]|nr:MAG: SGNH/GDSL hydrolase family protein [Acidobacteriota bacterium]